MKLTRKEMLGYGVGDLACGLLWNTALMFLMYFYTDVVGISVAQAGLLMLLARVADGFWDIGVGLWVDRTRSRFGRCRPFILFGGPVLALFAVACFWVPDLPPTAKLAYAYVSYIGMMLAYSLVNVPYGALPALMTGSSDERTRLAGVRMACATMGWMLVSGATLPLVRYLGAGNPGTGFSYTLLIYGLSAWVLLYVCFRGTRERVPGETATPNIRGDLKGLLHSRAWCTLAASCMLLFLATLIPAGAGMYYLTYVVKQPAIAPAYFLLSNAGNLFAVLVSDRLTRRWCKLRVLKAATLSAALVSLGFLAIDTSVTWQVMALGFTVAVVGFIGAPIAFSMVADAADSIELESGRRVVGLSASALSRAVKVGMGIGSAVTGLILAHYGYQPGVEQTPSAVHGILISMGLAPALALALLWIVLHAYPLDRSRLAEMQNQLALRRAGAIDPAS